MAYGVVDTENDCSWTWFFKQFKHAFGDRKDMCVVSDRNESIMKSVRIVFPDVLIMHASGIFGRMYVETSKGAERP